MVGELLRDPGLAGDATREWAVGLHPDGLRRFKRLGRLPADTLEALVDKMEGNEAPPDLRRVSQGAAAPGRPVRAYRGHRVTPKVAGYRFDPRPSARPSVTISCQEPNCLTALDAWAAHMTRPIHVVTGPRPGDHRASTRCECGPLYATDLEEPNRPAYVHRWSTMPAPGSAATLGAIQEAADGGDDPSLRSGGPSTSVLR